MASAISRGSPTRRKGMRWATCSFCARAWSSGRRLKIASKRRVSIAPGAMQFARML
jgi:hypothetical protein